MSVAQWAGLVLLGPLGITFLLVISSYFSYVARDPQSLLPTERMGPSTLDFSKSPSSTLTGVGTVFTAVLSSQILPNDLTPLSKDHILFLGLAFGVIVAVAGLGYNVFRTPVPVVKFDPTPPAQQAQQPEHLKSDTQYQGYVFAFLLASIMVGWAIVGELVTILLLLYELYTRTPNSTSPNAPLPDILIWIFAVLILAAILIASIYSCISIPWTLRRQEVHRSAQSQRLQNARAPEDANPALRDWALP